MVDVFDKEENRKKHIRDMLKTLTKREENVLRLYFGIEVENGRNRRSTLEEIGQDFDLTGRTIQKYKNKGIRKMMHPQRSKLLISHIDKDLIERCDKNWNTNKITDEFMKQLLYPPREIVEKWEII
jgi:DNA-binding NarL/FixJ family response regulator